MTTRRTTAPKSAKPPDRTDRSVSLWHLVSSLTADARGFPNYAVVTLAKCTAAAAIGGIAAEWVLAGVVGPVAPFLVGSSVAWCASALRAWQNDSFAARTCQAKFPDLFKHHLKVRHPSLFADENDAGPLEGDGDGVYRSGWAILAHQYARPAVTSLEISSESSIKDSYAKLQDRAFKKLQKKKTSADIPSPPSATRTVATSDGGGGEKKASSK